MEMRGRCKYQTIIAPQKCIAIAIPLDSIDVFFRVFEGDVHVTIQARKDTFMFLIPNNQARGNASE